MTEQRQPETDSREPRTTKLSAPTNFDDRLIAPLAQAGVYEIYGKLTADAVGGGRTSHVLPPVDEKRLRAHVALAKRAGIQFNYLLNAAAIGGMETTAGGFRGIRRIFDLVCEIGVDSITVTNPLLLELSKRHYPQLEVKVSAFANVVTPQQAGQWADMGADVITVSPVVLNRELHILKEIAAGVDSEIQVILNNNCIQSCAFYNSHANLHSHTSRKGHWSRGYMVDYCLLNCRAARLADPSLYIRGDWIRPEDLEAYEQVGVTWFKVVNRSNPTDVIIRRVQAYANRSFDGNLLELVEHAHDHRRESEQSAASKLKMARTFVRPLLVNPMRLKEFGRLSLPAEPFVEIDNSALNGFIDFFLNHSCASANCSSCRYCDEVANRVVKVDGIVLEEYRKRYRETLDKFLDGYFFNYFS